MKGRLIFKQDIADSEGKHSGEYYKTTVINFQDSVVSGMQLIGIEWLDDND